MRLISKIVYTAHYGVQKYISYSITFFSMKFHNIILQFLHILCRIMLWLTYLCIFSLCHPRPFRLVTSPVCIFLHGHRYSATDSAHPQLRKYTAFHPCFPRSLRHSFRILPHSLFFRFSHCPQHPYLRCGARTNCSVSSPPDVPPFPR